MGKHHFSLKYGQFPLVEFVEESGVRIHTQDPKNKIIKESQYKVAMFLSQISIREKQVKEI